MQRIFSLFDGYFLIMVLIVGVIVTCIDTKSYKQFNKDSAVKQSKIYGITLMVVALVLYVIGIFVLI